MNPSLDKYGLPLKETDEFGPEQLAARWLALCRELFHQRVGDKLRHRDKPISVDEALPPDFWTLYPKPNSVVIVVKPPTERVGSLYIPDTHQNRNHEGWIAIPGQGIHASDNAHYSHPLDYVGRRFQWRYGGGIIMQTDADEQHRHFCDYAFLGFEDLFCETLEESGS